MIQPGIKSHIALLNGLLFGYLVFVVYGSLVPLNYVPRDLDSAIRAFQQLPWLDLTVHSRADWVANALLFIPLTFMFAARLEAGGCGRSLQLLVALFGASLLAVAVEFSQSYFPPRTISQNDIFAEVVGALCGVLLWWSHGRRTRQLVTMLAPHSEEDAKKKGILALYSLAFFIYNVMPLDLTISAAELHEKWKGGRIIFNPLIQLIPGSLTHALETGIDLAVWTVFAILACQAYPGSATRRRNVLLSGAPLFIEAAQLFVFTRVTDSADIVVGLLGVHAGRLLAERRSLPSAARTSGVEPGLPRALRAVLIILVLSILTALPYLYPFNFSADLEGARERLTRAAGRTLFEAYYFGSEYRALTEVLHKVVPFFIFGAVVTALSPLRHGHLQRTVTVLLGVMVAGAIEIAQIFLPGKFPDLTDLVLETCGVLAGAMFWHWRSGAGDQDRADTRRPLQTDRPAALQPLANPLMTLLLAMAAAAAFAFGPINSYNVRELLPANVALQMLAVPLAMFVFGFPAYTLFGVRQPGNGLRFGLHLLLWAAIAVAMENLLPRESIDDIIGSAQLYDTVLERPVRIFFTLSIWFVPGALAVHLSARGIRVGAILYAALVMLVNAVIAQFVVVEWATTDNITELLAHTDSPLSLIALSFSAFCIALAACVMVRLSRQPGLRNLAMAALQISLLFGAALVLADVAFERFVLKYDRVFPALQFLLTGLRFPQLSYTDIIGHFATWSLFIAALVAVSCNLNSGLHRLLSGLFLPQHRGQSHATDVVSRTLDEIPRS